MPLMEATGLRAGYGGSEILHGVDLSVDAGEIVTIIGPNGSGKSTAMKAVVGVAPVTAGSVRFDGRPIESLPADRRIPLGICYAPQTDNVFPTLTIAENLEMGGFLLKDGLKRRADELYERFPDLAEKRGAKAGTLSGGQRQMLALARALMLDPKLLLLDEPSAGLSPAYVEVVFQRIRDVNASGVAILMVEQNAKRALSISDRGYVLTNGETRMTGPGPALAADPQVGRLYLGEVDA